MHAREGETNASARVKLPEHAISINYYARTSTHRCISRSCTPWSFERYACAVRTRGLAYRWGTGRGAMLQELKPDW